MDVAWRAAVCLFAALLLCGGCASAAAAAGAGGQCPDRCTCKWKGNKQTVECVNVDLNAVPANLDAGTQVLDLSSNPLHVRPFATLGLINLQRVYLSK